MLHIVGDVLWGLTNNIERRFDRQLNHWWITLVFLRPGLRFSQGNRISVLSLLLRRPLNPMAVLTVLRLP